MESGRLHRSLRGMRFRGSWCTWLWSKQLEGHRCDDQCEHCRVNPRASEERLGKRPRVWDILGVKHPGNSQVVVSDRKLA